MTPSPEKYEPTPEQVDGKVSLPKDLHPDTANLVLGFAAALGEKLRAAEIKYGYSAGWTDGGWLDDCRDSLVNHIEKGDPRDVAAYCAFLWYHKEPTKIAGHWKTVMGQRMAFYDQKRAAESELSTLRSQLDALKAQVVVKDEALSRIAHYPFDSEPVGCVLEMQELAHQALTQLEAKPTDATPHYIDKSVADDLNQRIKND